MSNPYKYIFIIFSSFFSPLLCLPCFVYIYRWSCLCAHHRAVKLILVQTTTYAYCIIVGHSYTNEMKRDNINPPKKTIKYFNYRCLVTFILSGWVGADDDGGGRLDLRLITENYTVPRRRPSLFLYPKPINSNEILLRQLWPIIFFRLYEMKIYIESNWNVYS